MTAVRTARERARAELTAEILDAARRQIAEQGAAALSLRAVARELGMASSAVYRYFATRDELLTALLVEAYDGLGEVVEGATAPGPGRTPRQRWLAGCTAVRTWALAHPHQYALLYGSPVPGYAAPPERTTPPGSRVPLALLAVLADAPSPSAPPLAPDLAAQAGAVADALAPDLGAAVLVQVAAAWTALFGLVSFELFGQFDRTFEPADALFAHVVERSADALGL